MNFLSSLRPILEEILGRDLKIELMHSIHSRNSLSIVGNFYSKKQRNLLRERGLDVKRIEGVNDKYLLIRINNEENMYSEIQAKQARNYSSQGSFYIEKCRTTS